MKGKKKRNKFKVGNQAFLSHYDSLVTNQDCNGVAPSTDPSTPPSSSLDHGLQNGSLIPTDRDKILIESLLEMKLSQNALDQIKYFSSTNKCESINRTMSTYLHKNKNFSCNAIGRASEAGLTVNNNRDVALVKTLKAVGCTMGKKSRAAV
ncbi:unnamed protein product [Mytilus coruscus]|uniref:Uncharacterized protein n=1 Tax=Mytilus coruscus TaxID=42192 RepID=A0A6J8EMG5_MYTCO|nr:unnamed protein product [Mytilus coruscus]